MDPKSREIHAELEADHFAHKRRGQRRLCVMGIEVTGATGTWAGRTVNISRNGALIEITDPAFCTAGREATLLEFATRALSEFKKSMIVRFEDVPLRVEASVLRVTRHPAAASLLLGCEFSRALTTRQCRVLGVPTEDEPETAQ